MRKSLYLVAVSLLLSVPLVAQTAPSGEGHGLNYWVGAAFTSFNPDYGCSSNTPFTCWEGQVMGLGPYMDTSSFLFGRIGAEGEAHFLRWHGPAGLTEDSYLGGPRVRIGHYKGFHFNGKFLLGAGHLDIHPPAVGTGTYFAFAIGGAVDYRVSRRLAARLDYEYQRWPGFKSIVGGKGGLTPNGLSLGFSYAFR
jgi:opacity protein-like surface antigen